MISCSVFAHFQTDVMTERERIATFNSLNDSFRQRLGAGGDDYFRITQAPTKPCSNGRKRIDFAPRDS